jgi:ATP-dependent helicase/nuclease subunit B
LFTLLLDAARERFYCSFQRADETGRALTPSWYVDELRRALKAEGRGWESVDIPRGIIEKATATPFDRHDLLLPKELATRLALEGRDPSDLVDAFAPLPALYRAGRQVAAALDQSGARLLAYDGVLDDPSGYWDYFSERGAAPTALEAYARCPFQFFARHVIGLETLERPEEILGPSAAEFGEIGHRILNWFYQDLLDTGHFIGGKSKVNIESTLQNAAERAFADYEANHPVGYPLAWESLKTSILELLRRVIAQDLSELTRSGFMPTALETDVEGRFPADWPEPLKNLKIRGRIDRIDRTEDRLRVIDYKFKFGAKPTGLDTDLPRAALRGERLQPPFYYLLAEPGEATATRPEIEADFYFIASRWADGPLRTSAYGSEGLAGQTGAATQQTLAYLVDGVRRGRFFIHRGPHCSYCDAAPICRKNHPPSLWRAENDPVTEAHRALRKKDPRDDEPEPDSY